MNKVTKILLIIFFILLFAFIILKSYTQDMNDMSLKVGTPVGGGELTMREYYTLVQCIETYNDYLKSGDYQTAYNILGSSYRNYADFETYEKNMQSKNIGKMQVENIDIVTKTTFKIYTSTSGEKENYSIILDNEKDRFSIYPESFLDYAQKNETITKKGLKCKLIDYVVNIDKTYFNFEITNTSKKEIIEISNSILTTNLMDTIENKEIIQIEPGETKKITLEYKTTYAFPTQLVLERDNLQYSFKFN